MLKRLRIWYYTSFSLSMEDSIDIGKDRIRYGEIGSEGVQKIRKDEIR